MQAKMHRAARPLSTRKQIYITHNEVTSFLRFFYNYAGNISSSNLSLYFKRTLQITNLYSVYGTLVQYFGTLFGT